MSCGIDNVTDEASCVVISSIVTDEASCVVISSIVTGEAS